MDYPILLVHRDWYVRARVHHWLRAAGYKVTETREGDFAFGLLSLVHPPWIVLLERDIPIFADTKLIEVLAVSADLVKRHAVLLLDEDDDWDTLEAYQVALARVSLAQQALYTAVADATVHLRSQKREGALALSLVRRVRRV